MMEQQYLVYCGERGWWGTGTYTYDVKHAKRFGREAAIQFCRGRYNPQAAVDIPLVPVLEDDLNRVMEK